MHGERLLPNATLLPTSPGVKPFMTAIIAFEEEGGQTRYTARVRHWSVEDKQAHEQMGFHQGWGAATDQLEALVAGL